MSASLKLFYLIEDLCGFADDFFVDANTYQSSDKDSGQSSAAEDDSHFSIKVQDSSHFIDCPMR